MFARYGVEYVLCGHTHTTTDVRGGGLHVYTVGGTAKVEDALGCGYSIVTITATSVDISYHQLDSDNPGNAIAPCCQHGLIAEVGGQVFHTQISWSFLSAPQIADKLAHYDSVRAARWIPNRCHSAHARSTRRHLHDAHRMVSGVGVEVASCQSPNVGYPSAGVQPYTVHCSTTLDRLTIARSGSPMISTSTRAGITTVGMAGAGRNFLTRTSGPLPLYLCSMDLDHPGSRAALAYTASIQEQRRLLSGPQGLDRVQPPPVGGQGVVPQWSPLCATGSCTDIVAQPVLACCALCNPPPSCRESSARTVLNARRVNKSLYGVDLQYWYSDRHAW
jgi:hypothetical protein